ncbi:alcohol dehydrogenase catalytic domain-containing protein [Paenibacillus lignilyticus]|uniref:Alcohol dehydrogenase catalytic domain-containing protein n=1 Tax=Paenibacillus lignilyticus TaxID=1172615 RepID=A0ABS5CND5_9BACL|nr:alcohol dehydrogenase catalytic domain-containing protein [Paenibacillus lignilyticus]MBP3967370.1 alcohol dehydrogenase catalytic domain-containing protein [Paenibacillus lignilyticus]
MKALNYQGMKKVKVKEVEDAKRIKSPCAHYDNINLCGSDLHIYNGEIPNMPENFIIGHEPRAPMLERVKEGVRRAKALGKYKKIQASTTPGRR